MLERAVQGPRGGEEAAGGGGGGGTVVVYHGICSWGEGQLEGEGRGAWLSIQSPVYYIYTLHLAWIPKDQSGVPAYNVAVAAGRPLSSTPPRPRPSLAGEVRAGNWGYAPGRPEDVLQRSTPAEGLWQWLVAGQRLTFVA